MANDNEPVTNQFRLLSVGLLGSLILNTVAFSLSLILIGYLLVRYQNGWVTYRSYALTSSVLLFGAWLILLIGSAVLLPRENRAAGPGQFGAILVVLVLALLGFLVSAVVCAIGLAQSQRTLTTDLQIVRTLFAVMLGVSAFIFLWLLAFGSAVLKSARVAYARKILSLDDQVVPSGMSAENAYELRTLAPTY